MVSKYKTKFKQTEIGMISEDWNVKELGNLSDFQYGLGESAQKKGDFVYIRITDINSDGFLDRSSLVFMDKEKVKEKYILKKGDVLVARTGASFGKTYRFNEDFQATYGGFLIKLLFNKNRIDNNFYFQFSRSKIYWDQANNLVGGGAQPQFNANVLSKMIVPCPGLSEQQSIAKILSSLDSKIELNQQINKILEDIGQALFKRWFIDFEFPNEEGKPYKSSGGKMVGSELGEMPAGWEEGCLGDILEISISGDWGADNEFEGAIQAISLRGTDLDSLKSNGYAAEAPIRWIRKDRLESRIVNNCNILIGGSGLGPIGKTIYCSEYLNTLYNFPVTYSNFCKCLTAEMPAFAIFAEHILENMYLSGEMNQFYTGTSIPNLDINSLMRYPIIIPSKDIVIKFYDIAIQKFLKLFDKENILLSQIRDSLLPRLMSGRIRVPVEARA